MVRPQLHQDALERIEELKVLDIEPSNIELNFSSGKSFIFRGYHLGHLGTSNWHYYYDLDSKMLIHANSRCLSHVNEYVDLTEEIEEE